MTDARLLAPGGGEDIGGRLQIKCDLESLAFTDTVGSSRTSPHVHETHADGFWVLEPGFVIGIGDEEIELEPGDFALAPPGLVHYFHAADSRWLNLHAPNAGFAEYLRSGADFDNRDAAEDDNRRVADAVLRRGDEGELIELATLELKRKVSALGMGIGFGVGALVFAVFAFGFLFATITAALATFLTTWLALLIVTVFLLLVAVTLGLLSLRALKRGTPPVPKQAIQEAKLTTSALKGGNGNH